MRQVAKTFIAAVTTGDDALACRQFTREAARVTFAGPCDRTTTSTPAFLKTYVGNARVTSSRVQGERAEVTVQNDEVGQTGLVLRKVDGDWKVANTSDGSRASGQDEAALRAMNGALLALGDHLDDHPDFAGADAPALRSLRPSIPRALTAEPAARTVLLAITSESGTTFRGVVRLIGGIIHLTDQTCEVAGMGRCPPDGTWR